MAMAPMAAASSNVPANSTAYTATGLTPNTTYWFRVRADRSTGNSAYSNVMSAKTAP